MTTVDRHDHAGIQETLERLAADPRLHRLVAARARFAWILSGLITGVFFGYILLIAFRRDILAQPIGYGVTSLGIPVGIGVILVGILLTGIYVRRANREFDPQFEALRREYGL